MEAAKTFSLPKLPYPNGALAPYISEQQLTLHHDKHHLAYVNGANAVFDKLEKARKLGIEIWDEDRLLAAGRTPAKRRG